VVTGRVDVGVVKVGDEVEIVGCGHAEERWRRAWRCSQLLDQGQAGTTSGCCWERRRTDVGARPGAFEAGAITPHKEVQGSALHPRREEGGRHTPFFNGVPSAVLLPYDGRDGRGHASRGVEMVMPGTTSRCRWS